MAGTKEGGVKAAQTRVERYGPDYHQKLGRKGGKAGKGFKGFATRDHEAIVAAARKGGSVSRRPNNVNQSQGEE